MRQPPKPGWAVASLGLPADATNLDSMRTPDIELLWWQGCPSTGRARAELEEALDEVGLGQAAIKMIEIGTDEEALGQRFVGSPTIRVDGTDVAPPESGEPAGLACRVYRQRGGRISPTPDPEDLREALRRALQAPH